MDLWCYNGDISTIGPDLWCLLAVPPEGKKVITWWQHWHLDKVDEVEVEAASPELILLFITRPPVQATRATGLAIAIKPSLGNTWHIHGINWRREHRPVFATAVHLSPTKCTFASGHWVPSPHRTLGESAVNNADRRNCRAIGLTVWHRSITVLDPSDVANKVKVLSLETLLTHLTDVCTLRA